METCLKSLDNKSLHNLAVKLIQDKKMLEVEILQILMEIKKRKYFLDLGFTSLSEYCEKRLGLTQDQARKRSQVATLVSFHPECLRMLEEDRTNISTLALIAPKITSANKSKILEYLPKHSRNEVKFFLSTITNEGKIIDREPAIELKFQASKKFINKLERARGLLLQSKRGTNLEEILEEGLDLLLAKIDPLKKAERAKAREEKKENEKKETEKCAGASEAKTPDRSSLNHEHRSPIGDLPKCSGAPGNHRTPKHSPEKLRSRYIPAHIRHAVILRDECRCTYVAPDGTRCSEEAMLQFDHVKLWCRGAGHSIENLRLRCPSHNRHSAEKELGHEFMKNKFMENKISKGEKYLTF